MKTFDLPVGGKKTVRLTEPQREHFADSLGGAVEYSLTHAVYKVLEVMGGGLGSFASGFLVEFLERMEPELVDYLAPILDAILETPNIPEELRDFLGMLRNPPHEIGTSLLMSLGSMAGGAVVNSFISAWVSPLTFYANQQYRPNRPTLAEAMQMGWRGSATYEQLHQWFMDLGWEDAAIIGFMDTLRPRATIGDEIAFAWRTVGKPDGIKEELLKRGFLERDADKLIELAHAIPNPQDLIRMAVRESFNPETIEKFELGSEFPPDFGKYMLKQGYTEEWAKAWWVAHWQLPSVQNTIDMFHRTTDKSTDPNTDTIKLPSGKTVQRVVGAKTLKRLIKTADISPFWRDKIVEISYNPYTRVDVRRMYRFGVLDEDEVFKNYLDLGSDEEHAWNLTLWTILDAQGGERDLTKSDVLAAYRESRIPLETAETYLKQLGYDESEIGVLISREDYRKEEKLETERKKTVKTLFVNHQIDEPEVYSRLGTLDLSSDEIRALVELWTIERNRKTSRPTVAQLAAMFGLDIIDEATLKEELSGHGYSDKYIGWYLELWKKKVQSE